MFKFLRRASVPAATKSQVAIVKIRFRKLTDPVPEHNEHAEYLYAWLLDQSPRFGDRIFVPGMDGQAAAVVVGLGAEKDAAGMKLKAVCRLATQQEIDAAHRKEARDLNAWLNMARLAAGLPSAGQVRTTAPEGYPEIPPVSGHADTSLAADYARAWKRLAANARDDEETKAFTSLSFRWRAVSRKPADANPTPRT